MAYFYSNRLQIPGSSTCPRNLFLASLQSHPRTRPLDKPTDILNILLESLFVTHKTSFDIFLNTIDKCLPSLYIIRFVLWGNNMADYGNRNH